VGLRGFTEISKNLLYTIDPRFTYVRKGISIMESKHIYLRFLNLIHALDGGANAPAMDLDAKKLLEVIAVRHAAEKPLTVTDAMALDSIASPATIHRKLDQLRELGMIDTVFEGKNRRTKYLVPTQAAHDYFEQVGQVMQQALAQA
jgi:DNA-binding transcriptional ArsR family regulator